MGVCRGPELQAMLDGEVKWRKKNLRSQNYLLVFSKDLESRPILLPDIPEVWIGCKYQFIQSSLVLMNYW
jgi:hypothetical protein